jgi:hypothetical protein
MTLEEYGGGISCPDNSGAWAKMMGAIGSNSATIVFEPGTYSFASAITATLTGPQAISFVGRGKAATQLFFPSSSGLTVVYSTNPWCRCSLQNLSIVPGSPAQYIGLILELAAPIEFGNPALSATTDLVNISIGNIASSGEWYEALVVDGVSNVNYDNLEIFGLGNNPNTTGVVVRGSYTPAVVHNFKSLNASFVGTGLVYGSNAQGVTISAGSNFTGNAKGVWVQPGINQLQLAISDSQFNHTEFGILDQASVNGLTVRGSFFIVGPGGVGVSTAGPGANIIGNTLTATGTNTNGIVLNSARGIAAHNTLIGLTTGVWAQASSSLCAISHNRGSGIVNLTVYDQGTGNVLTDNV